MNKNVLQSRAFREKSNLCFDIKLLTYEFDQRPLNRKQKHEQEFFEKKEKRVEVRERQNKKGRVKKLITKARRKRKIVR